jgi:hypothetical protein
MVFLIQMDGYQKLRHKQNVIKMEVIIKGVYYNQVQVFENKKFKESPRPGFSKPKEG